MIKDILLHVSRSYVRQPDSYYDLYYSGKYNLGEQNNELLRYTHNPIEIENSSPTFQSVTISTQNQTGIGTMLAADTSGNLWGWGYSTTLLFPLLPSGSTYVHNINRSSPVMLQSGIGFTKLSAGEAHVLAIKSNGTLWAWGRGTSGQLGDNTATTKSSPVQIGTDSDWLHVDASYHTSYAIKSNGTLWGWGGNTSYELGSGTNVNRSSPVQIGSATDWLNVFGAPNVTFAVKTDGTIYSVGAGSVGVGTGYYGLQSRSSPVQIGGGYRDIFPNVRYNARRAIKSDGTLWAWGTNTTLQAGIAPATNLTSPVQIGIDTDWYTSLSNNQTNLDIKKTIVT
jgi:alpha-tubulin suppressor-like RCC1 family protein